MKDLDDFLAACRECKRAFAVEALREDGDEESAVVYKSPQSYDDLLHEAHISWKKTEKCHPARDEANVLAKREALKKTERPSRRDCVGRTRGLDGR